MQLPPSELGTVHTSVTCPFPGIAEVRVGASGTVRGVADSAFEGSPVPTEFVAVTVNE